MIPCELLPSRRDRSWDYVQQVGVTHAIAKCAPDLTGRNPPYDIDALRTIRGDFATAGQTLAGLEGDQFEMRRINLGLSGRDYDLENYCQMLNNMGEFGIPLPCYNFMATIGWCRTHTHVTTRDGALTNRFYREAMPKEPVPDHTLFERLYRPSPSVVAPALHLRPLAREVAQIRMPMAQMTSRPIGRRD